MSTSSIRSNPGRRQEVERSGHLEALRVTGSAVPDETNVSFKGTLELIEGNAVVAEGVVTAHWQGECRRCLSRTGGEISQSVREIFEKNPTEGETYLLSEDTLDLEPMVRETV